NAASPRNTRRPMGAPSISRRIGTPPGLAAAPPRYGSAAVGHAGVLHAEDGRLLVGLEPGVDDLADEERVAAAVDRLAQLAVDPGGGDVEDGGARPPVVEGEPVEGLAVGVDLHRLHELPDGGPLLLGQEVEAEDPAAGDQLMGEGDFLHADADQL